MLSTDCEVAGYEIRTAYRHILALDYLCSVTQQTEALHIPVALRLSDAHAFVTSTHCKCIRTAHFLLENMYSDLVNVQGDWNDKIRKTRDILAKLPILIRPVRGVWVLFAQSATHLLDPELAYASQWIGLLDVYLSSMGPGWCLGMHGDGISLETDVLDITITRGQTVLITGPYRMDALQTLCSLIQRVALGLPIPGTMAVVPRIQTNSMLVMAEVGEWRKVVKASMEKEWVICAVEPRWEANVSMALAASPERYFHLST